jgi:hypothetical protein
MELYLAHFIWLPTPFWGVQCGDGEAMWIDYYPTTHCRLVKTVQIFWDKIAVWLKLFRYSGTKLPFG